MARVPTADQRVIPSASGPAFRNTAGASTAAFGAREGAAQQRGGQAALSQSDRLAAQALAIQEAENKKSVKKMDIELSERVRTLMYGDGDSDPGFMNRSGDDAVQNSHATVEAIEKARKEILSNSSNSAVRKSWDMSSLLVLDSTLTNIGKHTSAQRKVSEINTTEAWRENSIADGLAGAEDPVARGRALNAIETATEDLAALNGWSPEVAELERAQQMDRFHDGIVDRFLAPGDTTSIDRARKYFEDNRKNISGAGIANMEKKLRAASVTNKSAVTRQVNEVIDILNDDQTPENLASVQGQVAAMGEQGEELALALSRAVEDREVMSAFNQTSIGMRSQIVKEGLQATTLNPDEKRVLDKQIAALAKDQQAIADGNGMEVALKNRLINDLPPVDFSDANSWREREDVARTARMGLGVDISPLTKSEQGALTTVLEEGTLDQATQALDNIVAGGSKDLADRLAQDFAEDNPASAMAVATVEDRPATAHRILSGIRRSSENSNLVPSREESDIVFAEELEGLFNEAEDGETMAAIKAGALAILAADGDPSRNVRGDFDPDELRSAIQEVTGGILTNTQGRRVLAPIPGMPQGDFEKTQGALKAPDLVEFGSGVPVFSDGSPVPPSVLQDGAELVTSGPGRYIVHVPGQGNVQNLDGGAYEIDIRGAIEGGGLDLSGPSFGEQEISRLDPGTAAILGIEIDERGQPVGEADEPESPQFGLRGVRVPESDRPAQVEKPTTVVPASVPAPAQAPAFDGPVPRTKPEIPTAAILENQLMRDEGFGAIAYPDLEQEGMMIVGHGHAVLPGEEDLLNREISLEEAREILRKDIKIAEEEAKKLDFYKDLSPARQAVVSHMVFNLGLPRFNKFVNTQAAIRNQDWELAAEEMLDSVWHDQVGGRARRLAEIMRTGAL